MEVYNGRLIAYSMGNFVTYGRFNVRGQQGLGVVLETVLDAEGRFVGNCSTKQIGEGIPMRDPEGKALDTVRMFSAEDFPETASSWRRTERSRHGERGEPRSSPSGVREPGRGSAGRGGVCTLAWATSLPGPMTLRRLPRPLLLPAGLVGMNALLLAGGGPSLRPPRPSASTRMFRPAVPAKPRARPVMTPLLHSTSTGPVSRAAAR